MEIAQFNNILPTKNIYSFKQVSKKYTETFVVIRFH